MFYVNTEDLEDYVTYKQEYITRLEGEKDMKPNFRKFKKIVYHKTIPHGGWKKYKDAMKKAGFR